jgi:hypothetical protein
VVQWQRTSMLFARVNPFRDGGGRHVQVAVQPLGPSDPSHSGETPPSNRGHTADGMATADCAEAHCAPARGAGDAGRFGRFRQLQFGGGGPTPKNNIYFLTVRRAPRGGGLLGLFPAVLGGTGGVWCATSDDGVRWSTPVRVWEAAVVTKTRVRDAPIDDSSAAHEESSQAKESLTVLMQHEVHVSLGGPDYFETLCVNTSLPRLCAYRFGALPADLAGPALCTHMATAVRAHEDSTRTAWRRSDEFANLWSLLGRGAWREDG